MNLDSSIRTLGISTLRAIVRKNPETTGKLVRTLIDGIQIFKTNKEDSLLAMRRYLRGASDEILEETYRLFRQQNSKISLPVHRSNKNRP